MAQLFAVIVETIPEYYSYKEEYPEQDPDQIAWFQQQHEKGTLLCCAPFLPADAIELWG